MARWNALLGVLLVVGSAACSEPWLDLTCASAPPSLVEAVERGLTVEGATLTDGHTTVYVDPSISEAERYVSGWWWFAARIQGGGVDAVGVWLTSSIDAPTAESIAAANDAASRSSIFGPPELISPRAADVEAAADCVD